MDSGSSKAVGLAAMVACGAAAAYTFLFRGTEKGKPDTAELPRPPPPQSDREKQIMQQYTEYATLDGDIRKASSPESEGSLALSSDEDEYSSTAPSTPLPLGVPQMDEPMYTPRTNGAIRCLEAEVRSPEARFAVARLASNSHQVSSLQRELAILKAQMAQQQQSTPTTPSVDDRDSKQQEQEQLLLQKHLDLKDAHVAVKALEMQLAEVENKRAVERSEPHPEHDVQASEETSLSTIDEMSVPLELRTPEPSIPEPSKSSNELSPKSAQRAYERFIQTESGQEFATRLYGGRSPSLRPSPQPGSPALDAKSKFLLSAAERAFSK